ncbi:hypothetical protein CAPTEDRAFT_218719 [Capitella teleta]|uniref:Uncharacterized protein n=1 Tax=Capitella teleta TaxID=283909 RepID=X2ANP5_CAPTE|nr:hypothetical protein CAPTEDRAFT_218719 [Capitella teleta]|eukprot:ELT90064.1 hypothetical protein CAPTEDRAFT_218719 [Capitella teleta]
MNKAIRPAVAPNKEGRAINRKKTPLSEPLMGWTAAEDVHEIDVVQWCASRNKASTKKKLRMSISNSNCHNNKVPLLAVKGKTRLWADYASTPAARCPNANEPDYKVLQKILQSLKKAEIQEDKPSDDTIHDEFKSTSSLGDKLGKINEDEPKEGTSLKNATSTDELKHDRCQSTHHPAEEAPMKNLVVDENPEQGKLSSPFDPPSVEDKERAEKNEEEDDDDEDEEECVNSKMQERSLPIRLSYTQANITLRRPYLPGSNGSPGRSSPLSIVSSCEAVPSASDSILTRCRRSTESVVMNSWLNNHHPLVPPKSLLNTLPSVPIAMIKDPSECASQVDSGYFTELLSEEQLLSKSKRQPMSEDASALGTLQRHYLNELPRSRRAIRKNESSADSENNVLTYEETLFLLREGMHERPQTFLGPPPFKPQSLKNPYHRARENSQKRLFGQVRLNDFTPSYLSGVIDNCIDDKCQREQLFQRNQSVESTAGLAFARIEEEFQSSICVYFRYMLTPFSHVHSFAHCIFRLGRHPFRMGSAHCPMYLPEEQQLRCVRPLFLSINQQPPSESMQLYILSKKNEVKSDRSIPLGGIRSNGADKPGLQQLLSPLKRRTEYQQN